MPSNLEHQERSFARWGDRAEEVHTFLDEPVKTFGINHREFRHTVEEIVLVVEHRSGLFGEKYYDNPLLLQNIILDHIRDDMEESVNKRTDLYLSQNGESGEKRESYRSWLYKQPISEIVKVAKKYDGIFTIRDICREMKKISKTTITKPIEVGVEEGIFEKVSDCGVSYLIVGEEGKQIITLEEYQKVRSRTSSGPTGIIYRLLNYTKDIPVPT